MRVIELLFGSLSDNRIFLLLDTIWLTASLLLLCARVKGAKKSLAGFFSSQAFVIAQDCFLMFLGGNTYGTGSSDVAAICCGGCYAGVP